MFAFAIAAVAFFASVGKMMTYYDRVHCKECARVIRKCAHQEDVFGNIEFELLARLCKAYAYHVML